MNNNSNLNNSSLNVCACNSLECLQNGCLRNRRNASPPQPTYSPSLQSPFPGWEAQAMNNLADAIRELAKALSSAKPALGDSSRDEP